MTEPASGSDASKIDPNRVRYGFWVVVLGLVAVLIALGITAFRWQTATDVAAVLGLVTSVVGTVVGAFFGIQVGSQGKEKADADRREAEKEKDRAQQHATALSGALPSEEAARINNSFR